VADSGALLTFLQAAIQAVNVSQNLGDASSDTSLLLNVLSKTDRANMQFVTLPVAEPDWDPNRRVPSEPMATNVWNALKKDQALPVGTAYTDGNGAQLVVPDPTAAKATPSPTPSATPSVDPSEDSAQSTTDNTAQSASVENNAANEAAAQKNAAICPPKDK
jgi:putative transcriptional regulator